jgi:branched-chain amino acid transport system permease protein
MRTGNYKESIGQIVALSDSKAAWAWTAALIAALIVAPYLVGTYALTLMVSA